MKLKSLLAVFLGLAAPALVQASVSVTVNGSSYTIPQANEKGWGTNVTNWIQAISSNTLQPSGGTFSLSAELDLGAAFGLKSLWFKSRTANPAATGIFRLANSDAITFRNSLNSADLSLAPGADGILNYNGVALDTVSLAQTLTNKTISGASNTLSNIPNSATTATNANTASAIVARDGSGNFSAGTITANLTGNVTGTVTGNATNVTGTVAIANGGTGQVTAQAAVDALLPAQASNSGKFLTTNGSTSSWALAPTATYRTPTVQKFTTGSGTYTTPSSPAPIYIRVQMVGGGGGGAGSGTSGQTNGGAGGNTTFGTTLLVANGGGGGVSNAGAGGTGGTASLGTGPIGNALAGANGQSGNGVGPGPGGNGGVSPFGGNGWGGFQLAGSAAAANTGSGGGGAGAPSGVNPSGAGGSGGYVDAVIVTPSATYSYAVGAAGTAGGAGTSGFAGAAGGSGLIIVTEYYQ